VLALARATTSTTVHRPPHETERKDRAHEYTYCAHSLYGYASCALCHFSHTTTLVPHIRLHTITRTRDTTGRAGIPCRIHTRPKGCGLPSAVYAGAPGFAKWRKHRALRTKAHTSRAALTRRLSPATHLLLLPESCRCHPHTLPLAPRLSRTPPRPTPFAPLYPPPQARSLSLHRVEDRPPHPSRVQPLCLLAGAAQHQGLLASAAQHQGLLASEAQHYGILTARRSSRPCRPCRPRRWLASVARSPTRSPARRALSVVDVAVSARRQLCPPPHIL
jgi:hypothetical protein